MSERVDESRRSLCRAACALGGLVALGGCGGTKTMASCSTGSNGVGEANLAVGDARFVEELSVFVCRDAGGYYAMSSQCTHVGAEIDFVSESAGFKCPLHFSTFDYDGNVTMGPAPTALPHYELCTTESGLLIVDQTKLVTSDTRLVV